ncbi:CopD family protein [Halovivax sp.]|uniref:CopD family protein n=1 Tax=Halovivax sp. TaxID=1935978 RepID=UPI0025C557FF|nr:CopD family protein [Halovivax sp.]
MVDVAVSRIVHLVFAALWAGSVLYVALVVLPLARDGGFRRTEPLATLSGKLTTISRASAVVLLLTGGHLAGRGYSAESLLETANGQLVIVMTALWILLIGLVEVGSSRLSDGLEAKKLREPARDVLPIFRAGAVVAVALLVVAGVITTGATQLL